MTFGERGGIGFGAYARAHARDFVCCEADADASAADEYASVYLACCHELSNAIAAEGIVEAFRAVGAYVYDLDATFFQMGDDGVFERYGGVIVTYGKLHETSLLKDGCGHAHDTLKRHSFSEKGQIMIKLALSDLDDSLIRVGLPHATQHALDAIHAMLDAGLRFGPCTGRVPWDLHMLFAEDKAAYRTGVTVNGQLVYIDGELVYDKPIPHEGLQKVANTVYDFPGTALMINDFGNRYSVGISALEIGEYYSEFGRIGKVRVRIPEDRPIYKANIRVVGDKKRLHEVRKQLIHLVPELDFVYPNPHVNYIDVASKGWSKAKGVEVLVRELGIGLDEVVVFGDAENDLDVLKYVPNSVAMANATPAAAEAARWHIGLSADDAVADALLQIAEAAKQGSMPAFMVDKA